jgi:hypothetical protein
MSAVAEAISSRTLTHLRALEAESIHILREVVAEFAKPVMLYFHRQGFLGDAAPGAEGFLSRGRFRSRCCTSTLGTSFAR